MARSRTTQRMTGSEAIAIVRATGRSQAEVSRLMGISPVALQKWINGGNPAGATASLLLLIRERPEVLEVLAALKADKKQRRK
jgi:DNA-binding transcriptional regulator YiaG